MYEKSKKIIRRFQEKETFNQKEIDKLCSLSGSRNCEVRRKIAVLLGRISDEKAEKVLYKLSFDKDELVKLEAIDSMAMGKTSFSLQRLKQICFNADPYLRFFGVQSYCDVFLNFYRYELYRKKELLEFFKEAEKKETDRLVLAAIYKCEAICGNEDAVFKLIKIQSQAIEEKNYHLITPGRVLLVELRECLKNEMIQKVIEEYLEK